MHGTFCARKSSPLILGQVYVVMLKISTTVMDINFEVKKKCEKILLNEKDEFVASIETV